jgi:N-acetylmuramoyl-L-alanine amidase
MMMMIFPRVVALSLLTASFADAGPLPVATTQTKLPPRFLVAIDPGHGGNDTGCIHKEGKRAVEEKALTLVAARKLAAALKVRGIPSVLTRTSDHSMTLEERAARANKAGASVFLSLHVNSSPSRKDHGIETYVLNTTSNASAQRLAVIENGRRHNTSTLSLILSDLETTANYQDSVELACAAQGRLTGGLKRGGFDVKNRGVRQALFYVLMQTQMPSILVEMGFASNPTERTRLLNRDYQGRMAGSLAQALDDYRSLWEIKASGEMTPERQVLSAVEKRRSGAGRCSVL